MAAAAAWGWQRHGDDCEVSVAGARSGGGRCGRGSTEACGSGGDTEACGGGGGGDGGWTPSLPSLSSHLRGRALLSFFK